MAEKPQLPPPDKMIQELRTPNPSDVFFRELVSRESSRWQQNNPIKRGQKYSSLIGVDQRTADAFPELYFLSETVPIGSKTVAGMTQSDWVIWNWMTVPVGQSATNAEISALADAVTNPVYARLYTIRRSVYEASPTIATGTPLTALLGAKVINSGINYTQARVALIGPGSGGKITPVISGGVITHFLVERDGTGYDATSTMQVIGDGQDAQGQLIIQPIAAILTSQKKIEFPNEDPRSNEFVKVLRVYEVLPGPWIPFTRYDDDLGPIQGRRRAVLNIGQRGGFISPTGKRNYEGRDGSSVVSIEIEENFSNGTGTDPNNPTYPILVWDEYKDERGSIQRTSQIVVATGNEKATITVNGNTVTKIWFEPYQDNPFLLKKFVETADAPFPIFTADEYKDERGSIQRTTQLIIAVGNEVATFQRSGTDPIVTVTKTWFEPYSQDNPFLLRKFVETWVEPIHHDRKITSQFGGAELAITERTAEPGTQDLEHGLLIVSDELQTKSPNEQIRRTERASGISDWPILPGRHTDEKTGIVIEFTKQVVPANTPYPGRSGYRGPFVELQPYDWDKAFQIISRPNLDTLPGPEAWNIVHPVNFPPQLLSIEAVWSDVTSRLTNAQANSANVSVSSGAGGGVILTGKSGFRGYTTGVQAREYRYGSPLVADIAAPYKIFPSRGSVVLTQTDSRTQFQKGDDGGTSFGDTFRLQVHEVDIPEHFVDLSTLQILNATHQSPPVSALAISGGGSVASATAAGTLSRMEVRIPQSTPPRLISGQQFLLEIHVEEYGFGIWIINKISVNVP